VRGAQVLVAAKPPVCTYDMEYVSGLYPSFMYLINQDTVKTPTSDSCSNFCYMSADCAFAIYEVRICEL